MKKFIISFNYNGFLFRAKVLVKRDIDKMLISTNLITKEISFLLEEGTLLFMEQGRGFQLFLFKRDRSFEILDWAVEAEYVDKTQLVTNEVFSLS